jgi:hypothetical protein
MTKDIGAALLKLYVRPPQIITLFLKSATMVGAMSRRTHSILAVTSLLTFAVNAETKLGKPLTVDQPMAIQKVLANPAKLEGKTVQVKGKVTEVCKAMGCWMALVDPSDNTKMIRVQVEDGVIVFPKESVGKLVIAEGTLTKQEMTLEQTRAKAKHEAEEQGRKFDPAAIKHGSIYYEIAGTGAVLRD